MFRLAIVAYNFFVPQLRNETVSSLQLNSHRLLSRQKFSNCRRRFVLRVRFYSDKFLPTENKNLFPKRLFNCKNFSSIGKHRLKNISFEIDLIFIHYTENY